MVEEIGALIFSQLLGMAQYPGSPFTGNLFRDIIMFLIVPTIFIILVVYSMTGRIVTDPKLRMMLGVGAYLFIVAGGYYSMFALLAGPYFLFLIIFMGIIYFAFGHFTGNRPKVGGASGGFLPSHPKHGNYEVDKGGKLKFLLGMPNMDAANVKLLKNDLAGVEERIAALEKAIKVAEKDPSRGDLGRMTETQDRLLKERQEILFKLRYGNYSRN
ncbi:hypothetical protein HYZ41_01090 [archaeon]|nr:hypothetical protein [archaeon]